MENKLSISLNNIEIFEAIVSKFGNGAHVLLSKEYENKRVKILIGNPKKQTGNKISLNLFGNEILERKVRQFGTGFHITVPKECLGKKIKLLSEKTI